MVKRLLSAFLLLALLTTWLRPVAPAEAQDAPADYDVPNGHFFPTQSDGSGYLIANQVGVPLWDVAADAPVGVHPLGPGINESQPIIGSRKSTFGFSAARP